MCKMVNGYLTTTYSILNVFDTALESKIQLNLPLSYRTSIGISLQLHFSFFAKL